jgi:hypothetical protein
MSEEFVLRHTRRQFQQIDHFSRAWLRVRPGRFDTISINLLEQIEDSSLRQWVEAASRFLPRSKT